MCINKIGKLDQIFFKETKEKEKKRKGIVRFYLGSILCKDKENGAGGNELLLFRIFQHLATIGYLSTNGAGNNTDKACYSRHLRVDMTLPPLPLLLPFAPSLSNISPPCPLLLAWSLVLCDGSNCYKG